MHRFALWVSLYSVAMLVIPGCKPSPPRTARRSASIPKKPAPPPSPTLYDQWRKSGGYYFENYMGPGAVPLVVSVNMKKLRLKHDEVRQTDVLLLVDGRRVDWRQMTDVPMDKHGVALGKVDRLLLSMRPGVHEIVCQPICTGGCLTLFLDPSYGGLSPEEWQTDHIYTTDKKRPSAFGPVVCERYDVNPGTVLHVVVWTGPTMSDTLKYGGIGFNKPQAKIVPVKAAEVLCWFSVNWTNAPRR